MMHDRSRIVKVYAPLGQSRAALWVAEAPNAKVYLFGRCTLTIWSP
jgi:hypothetical protein